MHPLPNLMTLAKSDDWESVARDVTSFRVAISAWEKRGQWQLWRRLCATAGLLAGACGGHAQGTCAREAKARTGSACAR